MTGAVGNGAMGGMPPVDPWHDRADRGRLANEVPFRPDLRLKGMQGLAERLALPVLEGAAGEARRVMLANVVYAAARGPETWVFYSRDWNFYADLPDTRASGSFFALVPMRRAVQSLEAAELVEHRRTRPSPSAEFRSRLRAAPPLIRELGPLRAVDFVFEPASVIVLRDSEGHNRDFQESRDLRRIRRDIEAQNKYLRQFDIRVEHARARYDKHGFLFVDERWLNPYRKAFHRVFNGSFSRGGRWYGPFWQSLPSEVRKGLLIDDQATIELDYRACHPRLLCALAGLDLSFEDPDYDFYGGTGIARAQAKLAFNIALNASDKRSGLAATAERFREEGWDSPHPLARQALDTISRRHPSLTPYFNTGIGLRLQNHDARICARVQRHFRQLGHACLSVHDSFIVQAKHEDELRQVMNKQIEEEIRRMKS